jgi:hypothetical protein
MGEKKPGIAMLARTAIATSPFEDDLVARHDVGRDGGRGSGAGEVGDIGRKREAAEEIAGLSLTIPGKDGSA